jgi:type I restriction enzyme, S subunit
MIEIEKETESKMLRPLPKYWRWGRLVEVCDAIRGITFQSGEAKSVPFEKSIACLTTSGVQTEVDWGSCCYVPSDRISNQDQYLRYGDLLVSTANSKALVGKSCLVRQTPFPSTFGAFVTVLRPKSTIDPFFLASWMRSSETLDYFYLMSSNTTNISNLRVSDLLTLEIPLPPLTEQQRIASILSEQMVAVEQARTAVDAQLELLLKLIEAELRQSLLSRHVLSIKLNECLEEVSKGVGENWNNYRVIGATRAGLAPAKENIGKNPGRYKLVEVGTVFYNPMRILLGSIAIVDDDNEVGITSPDYVVFKTRNGVLHSRWFYYWLRSSMGEDFIKTLTRGAVRERMLFKRLASAEIDLPPWNIQLEIADKLKLIAQMKRSLEKQLVIINQLPDVLLRRAFRGEH